MGTRFVIIGAARTGSTLLVKTLNDIEGLRCHGELLNNDAVRGYADGFDPYAATPEERKARIEGLDRARKADPAALIADALSGDNPATGFKCLYSALFDSRWRRASRYLLSQDDIHFVHLVRNNNLRRYVSEQILVAGGTNHSAVGGRSNRSVSVNIDIKAFLADSEKTQLEIQRTRDLLADRQVLEVSYETLAASIGSEIARICAFLGLSVDPASVEPALKKVGAANLRDSVQNYEELARHPATRELLEQA